MSEAKACSCISEARQVDYAYQPIVSTSTFDVHGFEALARPTSERFANVVELLNCAHEAGELRSVEGVLLRSAIRKFAGLPERAGVKLFCNVDNRTYDGSPLSREALTDLIGNSGIAPDSLCIEISERQAVTSFDNLRQVTDVLTDHGATIAIDDFGIGNSGLHMLLKLEPNYVKIDQFFIADIATNTRRQAIVSKLCGLAHALGFRTVAEGVENEADFRMARDLGCDMAQGFHIARPTVELRRLSGSYRRIVRSSDTRTMEPRVADRLVPIVPVHVDQPIASAVEAFKQQPTLRLLPVVGANAAVLGGIYEEDVRQLMMSDFGRSLLANKGMDSRVGRLLRRCPVADANGTIESIVNSYVAAESSHGLILVSDGRFAGYLSNNSVLRLATEKEVNQAREQNPLSRLPGNKSIEAHWDHLARSTGQRSIAFLDFDHFKAFNDAYGFALGDRALLLFADLLRKIETRHEAFVGHIGGDDFLVSLPLPSAEAEAVIRDLQQRFASAAESLYTADDREAGGLTAIDRFGVARFFPLLRASAGVVHFPEHRLGLSREELFAHLNASKAAAKRSADGLAGATVDEQEPERRVGAAA
jgi:diguanylate cyclase (GGDEF)-like protein